jgi:hypothetical protein
VLDLKWPLVCAQIHSVQASVCKEECIVLHLYIPYTFPYVPCNPLAILANCVAKLYVPIRSVQPSRGSCELCCKVIRSYTFRATVSRFLRIVLQCYTFLYVPRHRSRNFRKLYCKVVRAYTFRKRSFAFLQVILKMLSESYTFLYVPMPFLYVPSQLY